MALDESSLAALDRDGYRPLEALTYGGLLPKPTHARPTIFLCGDGKAYWVKGMAQHGLMAELVAGRLGAKVGASPIAHIIHVRAEAVPSSGEADHLTGIVVGTEDVANAVNGRDLQQFLGAGQFLPEVLNPASRARVVAFQTWIGVDDAQVLVRLTDGVVFSIDHGASFSGVSTLSDPSVRVTSIPGVSDEVGKEARHVQLAVDRIESIDDEDLLDVVARMPTGESWQSPPERRLQIARWLAHRRQRIREVMRTWLRT